jgi:hypothetical protein
MESGEDCFEHFRIALSELNNESLLKELPRALGSYDLENEYDIGISYLNIVAEEIISRSFDSDTKLGKFEGYLSYWRNVLSSRWIDCLKRNGDLVFIALEDIGLTDFVIQTLSSAWNCENTPCGIISWAKKHS